MTTSTFEIGQIVIPNDIQYPLQRGTDSWPSAIVALAEPLILVVPTGEYRVTSPDPSKFTSVAQATPEQVTHVQQYLTPDEKNLIPAAPGVVVQREEGIIPLYKSTKQLFALKLVELDYTEGEDSGVMRDDQGHSVRVSSAFIEEYELKIGGYYTRTLSGKESFSPSKAFESSFELDDREFILGVSLKGESVINLAKPARHHDLIAHAYEKLQWPEKAISAAEQGFFTNKRDHVSREDALKIALETGQVKSPSHDTKLFSEDVWQ